MSYYRQNKDIIIYYTYLSRETTSSVNLHTAVYLSLSWLKWLTALNAGDKGNVICTQTNTLTHWELIVHTELFKVCVDLLARMLFMQTSRYYINLLHFSLLSVFEHAMLSSTAAQEHYFSLWICVFLAFLVFTVVSLSADRMALMNQVWMCAAVL